MWSWKCHSIDQVRGFSDGTFSSGPKGGFRLNINFFRLVKRRQFLKFKKVWNAANLSNLKKCETPPISQIQKSVKRSQFLNCVGWKIWNMMNLIQLNLIKEFETKLGCLTYL